MNNFKNLKVWQISMKVAKQVFKMTDQLQPTKKFALIDQLCRCSLSIPSNIAEGSGRNSDTDYSRFISIALGSSYELETQLLLCKDLNYIKEEELNDTIKLVLDIQKMLIAFRNTLNSTSTKIKTKPQLAAQNSEPKANYTNTSPAHSS